MSLLNRVIHQRNDSNEMVHGIAGALKSTSEHSGSLPLHIPGISHHNHHHNNHGHHHTKQVANESPKVNLAIELESPPAVLYGSPAESTGSIISGLLLLNNENDSTTSNQVELEYVTLSLVQTIRLNKPFLISSNSVTSCKDCTVRKNILARWDVVTGKSTFAPGSHAYPFSHLLPGSLPASAKLGSKHSVSFVKYDLMAVAKKSDSDEEVKVMLPLNITRLILKGPDRNSLRVFPPTEINASALLPNVVYPKSTFPMELKLENLVNDAGDKRWRLRKLSWRVEELSKIKTHCCTKHMPKLKAVELSIKERPQAAHPKAKSSNVHYSTIQTDTFLSTDTNDDDRGNNVATPENADSVTGLSGAPVMNVDLTEVERNAPSHALDNFNEDFGPGDHTSPNQDTSPGANSAIEPSPQINPVLSAGDTNHSPSNEPHLYISESRTVSHGDIKSGWKSDFSGKGKVELVADINAMNLSTGLVRPTNKASSKNGIPDETQQGLRFGANTSCDIEDPNEGIFVSHVLVVELVVAEEAVSTKKKKSKTAKALAPAGLEPVTSQTSTVSTDSSYNVVSDSTTSPQVVGTPTGAARVLRMQFKLVMTERSGLGISWDDEVPPTYDDVRTLSPPTYNESSGNSTPQSNPLLPVPSTAATRTPAVLYGMAETPGMNLQPSIDGMVEVDERIQDLTL